MPAQYGEPALRMRAFTLYLLPKIRVLSRRRYFAASFQSRAYLAAMKAHVSQFPIAESAQDNQIRLAFAMNEKSRDAFIDEQVKKPSADRAGVLPNEGRPGIAGVAVQ